MENNNKIIIFHVLTNSSNVKGFEWHLHMFTIQSTMALKLEPTN